ncbi:phosphate ABC transporter permease subunit PstC [Butyricicoccus sp.]|uniref:phosphate ABC transporter permease subunit PstC n=1 Tax=Butyricicoccus sp. TaxID=2049021 RepID=UPI003D7C9068
MLKRQKLMERGMSWLFALCACMSIVAVALICVFLFANGIPAMKEIGLFQFLLGTDWAPKNQPASYGILPMIVGSLCVTAGAVIIGLPIGLLTAIYLSRFCPEKLHKVLEPLVQLMAGIPSIIYGFFGLVVMVPLARNLRGCTGVSMLTAAVLLGIMILPTIINLSESALNAVPNSYYEGALALGSTHEHATFFAVLPAAKSGILAAAVLGIGRAIGETMAVIMVAGNQARIPTSILRGVRTMTANIVLEMGYATGLHRQALIATGVVLFVFILIINITFAIIKKRGEKI